MQKQKKTKYIYVSLPTTLSRFGTIPVPAARERTSKKKGRKPRKGSVQRFATGIRAYNDSQRTIFRHGSEDTLQGFGSFRASTRKIGSSTLTESHPTLGTIGGRVGKRAKLKGTMYLENRIF